MALPLWPQTLWMPVASLRTIQHGLRFHGQSIQQFLGSSNVVEALDSGVTVPPPTISALIGKVLMAGHRIAQIEPANQPIIFCENGDPALVEAEVYSLRSLSQ